MFSVTYKNVIQKNAYQHHADKRFFVYKLRAAH